MPRIRKPLSDITPDDVAALCRDRVLEDEQFEIKRSIAFKDEQDPWSTERRIADRGRNGVLAEIVAFANSYGGDLVLGIEESREKPGRAQAVMPIPDCEDAANRLGQMASECIAPPIPNLQVRAITLENGAGVVIFRVPQSRAGPHRLELTKECYHRVRHETKPMTMRQIQDLTFSVARGLDRVEGRLNELRKDFDQWSEVRRNNRSWKCIGLRVACVPATPDCYLDHVHNVDQVRPRQRTVRIEVRPGVVHSTEPPFDVQQWSPILRGSEGARLGHHAGDARLQVHCDGAIVYDWRYTVDGGPVSALNPDRHVFYVSWFVAVVVNALEAADRFRSYVGMSSTEYAVEIDLISVHRASVYRLGGNFDSGMLLSDGHIRYPRYALGAPDSLPDLLTRIWTDLWNSIGADASGDYLKPTP